MLEDLIRDRKEKLSRYEEELDSAYPARVRKGIAVSEFYSQFNAWKKNSRKKAILHGRLFSLRDQGKIVFGALKDETGSVQVVFTKDKTADFKVLKSSLDAGDIVEVEGGAFVTKRKEKSLLVRKGRIISKSVRPLPLTWYKLEDEELKLRKRYLDLLLDPDLREMFRKKSLFWNEFRAALTEAGYLEVETPVLESVPGGAETEPFVTHHNALDRDFYLRISLELPLKKLLVGGFARVFEIGRIFRNEGIDREHLQDYTQMECYAAYEDYTTLMKFIQKTYQRVIKKVFGTLTLEIQGKRISWGGSWDRVDYFKAFKKEAGLDLAVCSREDLEKKAQELGLEPEPYAGKGRLIDLVYKKTVRPKLVKPCFLVDPPVEVEPLAKRHPSDPRRVERFQVVALGTELGKGFSELNDPQDQRERFEEQMALREEGDPEAQMLDEDFLEALEYGMPPAAGFGVSERLFAVLMDRPIRETTMFPLMREKKV